MKKTIVAIAVLVLSAFPAFAAYTVVMKDGTRYQAKAKWTVANGKALIRLENGQTLSIDPALIDVAKSEEVTKSGLRGATVLAVEQTPVAQTPKQAPSLGSAVQMRPRAQFGAQTAPASGDGRGASPRTRSPASPTRPWPAALADLSPSAPPRRRPR